MSRGPLVELGAPPAYTEQQWERVHAHCRSLERARARLALPRLAVGALAVGAFEVVVGAGLPFAAGTVGVLAAGLAVLAFLPDAARGGVWRDWAVCRRQLEAGLRALGAAWVVVWDRRLTAAPTPVTVAVGPSGVWVLWVPEPEWAASTLTLILDRLIEDLARDLAVPAFALHAAAIYTPAEVLETLGLMASAVPQASCDDVRVWADRLDQSTLQDPVIV